MNLRRLRVSLVAVALTAGACGGGSSSSANQPSSFDTPFTGAAAYPIVISSQLIVGENRVVIGLLNKHDAPIGSPKTKMHLRFFNLQKSETTPTSTANTQFIWAIPGVRGVYAANGVRFDQTGKWGVEVSFSGGGLTGDEKTSFEVKAHGTTPPVGSPAPPSSTLTIHDASKLGDITSDPTPVRRFYETSIAQAIAQHEPFVVVFATPKYCTSQVCGPTLERVEHLAPDFPTMTFIHVEIYDLSKAPAHLVPVPADRQWGLPSEPWVFLVSSKGNVAGEWEGTVSSSDLSKAISQLH